MKITPEKYWELKHKEDELMSQRLSWLLTSQIVLFALYGVLLSGNVRLENSGRLTSVIELLGITIACLILLGIIAAIIATCILYRKVNVNKPISEKQSLGVHPVLTVIGWLVAALIPVIFIIARIMMIS